MRVAHLCTPYIAPRWRRANTGPADDDDAPEPFTTNHRQHPIPLRQEFRCHITRTGPHPQKQRTDQRRLDGGYVHSTQLRDSDYVLHNLAAQAVSINTYIAVARLPAQFWSAPRSCR